jgi:hypothetical protein
VRKRDIRLSLGAPLCVDGGDRGALVKRSDTLSKFNEGIVDVDCLRTPAGAGDNDVRVILVPGAHSRVTGIAVLAARPGSARGLHVHGRVIPSQPWSSYQRNLVIKNRDSRV